MTKTGVALVIGFLVMSLVFAVWSVQIVNDSDRANSAKQAFLDSPHTCPNCGWTGHVGLMNRSGDPNGFFYVTYYCPVCGYILGRY